jgi:hypothetical protein
MLITIIKRTINYLAVKHAVRNANKLHKISKRRHYVIKIYGKVRVYDRAHINFLINEGVLHKKLRNWVELEKHCLYFTK